MSERDDTNGWERCPRSLIRSDLPSECIHLYLILRTFNGPGGCFPSQETLWSILRCSKRSLQYYLDALQEAGWIARRRRWVKAGDVKRQVCEYTFGESRATEPPLIAAQSGTEVQPLALHSESEVHTIAPDSTSEVHSIALQVSEVQAVAPHVESEVQNATRVKCNQSTSNCDLGTETLSCATSVAHPDDFALTPTAAKTRTLTDRQKIWFDTFWNGVWKKRGKGQALSAFRRLVRNEDDFRLVIAGRDRDIQEFLTREEQYRPHPSTWLNSEDWREYSEPHLVRSSDPWDSIRPSRALSKEDA